MKGISVLTSPFKIFAVFSFAICAAIPAKSAEIVAVSDEWCPYNCEPDSDRPGYVVEVAAEILADAGHTLKYLKVPWARALLGMKRGRYHIALGAYKRPGRKFIYPSETVGKSVIGFITNLNSKWTFNNIDSLRSIKSGIIRGYAYNPVLDKFYAANPSFVKLAHGSNALERSIKSLLRGEVENVVGDVNVLQEKSRQLNKSHRVRSAGSLKGGEDLYLAISDRTPEANRLADFISKGIVALRKSGHLDKILQKYGVRDWK